MRYLNFATHTQANELPETLLTLIDLSGSMEIDDIKPTRRIAAIKANHEIVKVKALRYPDDKIGVIGFQTSAKLLLAPTLSASIRNLSKTIDNAVLSGGTDFVAPLKLAYNYFSGKTTSAGKNSITGMLSRFLFDLDSEKTDAVFDSGKITKRIIMLTDGEHLGDGNPVHIAKRLKSIGVTIDCIGIGGSPDDVDERLLRQIASRNADGSVRYCFIGDQEQLIQKYQTLATHIKSV